jgi:hypothetical protein
MSTLTIQADENNDIAIADGRNIAFISGQDACAQNLLEKSLMRLGENQYDTTDGVDYFGTIFTPQPNFDDARQSIMRNLLECPDVISIQSLTITIAGDVFTYVAMINTIYGPVNLDNSTRA